MPTSERKLFKNCSLETSDAYPEERDTIRVVDSTVTAESSSIYMYSFVCNTLYVLYNLSLRFERYCTLYKHRLDILVTFVHLF